MPPWAMRASTAYRPSTSLPISGSGPATTRSAYGWVTANGRNAAGAAVAPAGTGAGPHAGAAGRPGCGRTRRRRSREPPAQREDVGDVPAGVREHPVRAHRAQPLIVGGDRRLLRCAGGEGREDGDPGHDVVAGVEQVQVAPDQG